MLQLQGEHKHTEHRLGEKVCAFIYSKGKKEGKKTETNLHKSGGGLGRSSAGGMEQDLAGLKFRRG